MVKEFIEMGLDEITISLWAATPETYARTHPNKNEETFKRIVRVIKYMQDYKKKTKRKNPVVKLYNVIFSMNYQEVIKMVNLAVKLGVEMIEFAPLDPIPEKTEYLLLNENQRRELIKELDKIKDYRKKNKNIKLRFSSFDAFYERVSHPRAIKGIYDAKTVSEIPCYVGWVFARIMADGSVIPCLKAHKLPLGNINKQNFKKIWNSKKYKKFRQMAINYKKTHPYFRSIGNNPKYGCFSSCDNRGDNNNVNKNLIIRLVRNSIFKLKNSRREENING